MNRDHVQPACPFPKRWNANLPWSCPDCHRVWVRREWPVQTLSGKRWEGEWRDTGVTLDA